MLLRLLPRRPGHGQCRAVLLPYLLSAASFALLRAQPMDEPRESLWKPDDPVGCLLVSGSQLYAGGEFLSVGTQAVYPLTAFSTGPSVELVPLTPAPAAGLELRVRDGTSAGSEVVVQKTLDWHEWSDVDGWPVSGQPTTIQDSAPTGDRMVIYRALTR